jgi:hypothetical protein
MRTKKAASVECRKGHPGLGPNLTEAILDYSAKGARLILLAEVSQGQRVELLFRALGEVRPLRAPGRVAWALPLAMGGFCVGVRFDRTLSVLDMQRLALTAP